MPRLSCWLIRSALMQFALGALIGALLLIQPLLHTGVFLRLAPLHVEMVMFGWLIQLAMGVGYWMMPKERTEPERGNPRLGWVAFGLLNVGILLAGIGGAVGLVPDAALAGRVAEVLALAAFAALLWPRVKGFGL